MTRILPAWSLWTVPGRYLRFATARAAAPSEPSLLRVSGIAGIAIAAFCVLYFAWQFTR
jgi:hypothetical protein